MEIRSIVMTGVTLANKGSEAMLRCVQQELCRRAGVEDFIVLASDDFSAPSLLSDLGMRPFTLTRARKAALRFACRLGLLSRRTRYLVSRYIMAFREGAEPSAVVDVSGYHYHDFPMTLPMRARYLLLGEPVELFDLFQALDIPVVYMPQAWGPFTTPHARRLANRLLESATLVYARDQDSYRWLEGLPAFCPSKVRLGSDIAFLLSPAPAEVGTTLLAQTGANLDAEPIVGVVPSIRVYRRLQNRGLGDVYVKALVNVASYFARELGCQVVLMPHELKQDARKGELRDDRYVCKLVADALPHLPVYAALGTYTADQLKSMIGLCRLLVSSRYHSIVGALSLRRPVIAISWAHKYVELLRSLGISDFVVPDSELGTSDVVSLCGQAWKEYDALVAKLEQHVPEHEASARLVMEEVAGVISRASEQA